MKQFSIKNDEAADLLERITARTGEGKTEAIKRALALYERKLLGESDVIAQIEWIKDHVHPFVDPQFLGRAPSKSQIESELELG